MPNTANKSKSRTFRVIIIAIVAVIALAILVPGVIYINTQADKCKSIPEQVDRYGGYTAPCEITVTVIQQGQEPNPEQERATLQKALQGYDANIRNDSLPDIGVYYVEVAFGKENLLIDHLKSQPGISNAARQMDCTKDCKLQFGPN